MLRTQVRPYNLATTMIIRDLNPSDIDKLVSIQGMVTRTSGTIPDMRCVPQAALDWVACVYWP